MYNRKLLNIFNHEIDALASNPAFNIVRFIYYRQNSYSSEKKGGSRNFRDDKFCIITAGLVLHLPNDSIKKTRKTYLERTPEKAKKVDITITKYIIL